MKQAEYTPSAVARIEERPVDDLLSLTEPALIRKLRIESISKDDSYLSLHALGFDVPLVIHRERRMVFGTETVTSIEYVRRVLERGDLIDVVARPMNGGIVPIDLFWIHIVYVGMPRDAGTFSRKEDGLFALRAKAGEKGERIVAKILRDKCGHSFDPTIFQTPGYFEIRYDKSKKQRRPDLKCLRCGVTFEVKKRNRDMRFRVSHSEGRPFSSENSYLGWHAFVFPDMKPRFLSNAVIERAIAKKNFARGADQYDSWADVYGDEIVAMSPPQCRGDDV